MTKIATNPRDPVDRINAGLSNLLTLATNLRDIQVMLHDRLLGKAEAGVIDRVKDTAVEGLHILINPDNQILGASARTGTGGYSTAMTFHPRTAHKCTCPDWDKRRRACKHVLALAEKCDLELDAQVKAITGVLTQARSTLRDLEATLAQTMAESLDHLTRP